MNEQIANERTNETNDHKYIECMNKMTRMIGPRGGGGGGGGTPILDLTGMLVETFRG